MGYVTYEYYTEKYGGRSVSKDDFTRLENNARMYVDKYTFNRLVNAAKNVPEFIVPEQILNAECAIIDILAKSEQMDGKEIASETTSKQSVTYAGVKTFDLKIKDVISLHLGGTPWTYKGGGVGYVTE